MDQQQIEIINDGQSVDKDFVSSWDILEYCDRYNGNLSISFVGIIIKNNKVLFSFPKHYQVSDADINSVSCMKQILRIVSRKKASSGSFDKGEKGEFPIKAYLGILSHFKKYGLYLANERYFFNGYEGNVDWNRTINKSNKVVQNKGIIYFPFVIKKSKDKRVFISECMEFALSDASKYKDFITSIIPYDLKEKNKKFSKLSYVINELKQLRSLYFKDIEKKLIQNLIDYMEWKSKNKENVRLLTLKFEDYWEEMVNEFLKGNFVSIENDRIIWEEGKENNFYKPNKENVESDSILEKAQEEGRTPYKIQYDHFLIDDSKKEIVLFDSKYFNEEVSHLNYKQLFYHYNLKGKFPEYNINNGLLLPTKKDYYSKVHVDRLDLDGIKIIEHYINLNLVLDYYSNNI